MIRLLIGLCIFFPIGLACNINANKLIKKISIAYVTVNGIILFISTFNPVYLNNVSNFTYVLWIINILCFSVGILLLDRMKKKSLSNCESVNNETTSNENTVFKIIDSKGLLIVELILCALLIFYNIKYQIVISTLENAQIRIASFTLLFNSALETLFYNYIIGGGVTITSILLSIMILKKQFKKCSFFVALINILLFSLIGYGRMTIFNVVIYVLIGLLIEKHACKKINYKSIILGIGASVLIILFFIGTIFIRMSDSNKSTFDNIKQAISNQYVQTFEYFLGGLRTLDEFVINGFEEMPKYTYGRATLSGIDEIVLYPLKGIGLEIESFNNKADQIMSKTHKIGERTDYFNAFYTAVMNFYLDFGIIGVFLFPLLYALFVLIIVRRYEKNEQDVFVKILLYYVLSNWFFTILKWNYQAGSNMFVLLILIIFVSIDNKYNKKKVNGEK